MLRKLVISNLISVGSKEVPTQRSNDLVGEVVNDSFDDLNLYGQDLSNTVITGKQVVSTANTVDNIYYNGYASNSENQTVTLTGVIDDLDAVVGIRQSSEVADSVFDLTLFYTASTGRIEYVFKDSANLLVRSSTAITPQTGSFTMAFTRNGTSMTGEITLGGETVSVSHNASNGANLRTVNFRKYGVACYGGTFTLGSFVIEDTNYQDVDYIYFGDSITAGAFPTTQANRHFDLVADANPNKRFVNLSGGGNKIEHYNLDEFNKFSKSATIVLLIGTNSALDSSSVFTSNYQALLTGLTSLGFTNIVTCSMIPRSPRSNIVSYNSIIQNEGYTYIDLFTPMSIDGTTNDLNESYDSGDNTHLGDLGNSVMAQNIAQGLNLSI